MTEYSITLLQKEQLTPNVFEFRFDRPRGFTFLAGQFVQLMFPQGDKMIPRSYSLSSTPQDNYLEFCVKYFENGVASTHFAAMKPEDTLIMRGPQGRFLADDKARKHICIATGTGLVPIMSILRDELHNKRHTQSIYELLFGVRHQEDLFWEDHLDMMMTSYDNFQWHRTLSQPTGQWSGETGRVTEYVDRLVDKTAAYYICGSAEMVMDVRKKLTEKGIQPTSIHFEIF
jgi:ferredoxin-NADP reductase